MSTKAKNYKIKINWFTLIEIILSITIFAIILVSAFDIMWKIWIGRLQVSNKLDINKDLYYTIESLVSTIKDFWWDIDYEEYWNRQAIWTETLSWHYEKLTWYGNYLSWWIIWSTNYWEGLGYVCISWSWVSMWTWWCLENYNFVLIGTFYYNASSKWKSQGYGQYARQFYDYNANQNYDSGGILWDEDWNWSPLWDDDDEDLWEGPVAFSWNEVKELYLFKNLLEPERLFLRLNIIKDPNAPDEASCNFTDWTWSWCLWNIQILRLDWYDLWYTHDWTNPFWLYDWILDTWRCNKDFSCTNWPYNLPTGNDDEWVNLFPDYINVKSLKLFLYPNKNYVYAWKENNSNININPYIRINITLWFSWEKRKKIQLLNPELSISTTINLTKN